MMQGLVDAITTVSAFDAFRRLPAVTFFRVPNEAGLSSQNGARALFSVQGLAGERHGRVAAQRQARALPSRKGSLPRGP